MASCPRCGAPLLATGDPCSACHSAAASNPAPVGTVPSLALVQAGQFRVWQRRTDQQFGPIPADAVKQWIAERRIVAGDMVIGGQHADWISLEVSEFRQFLFDCTNLNQLAAATCPRCGGPLTQANNQAQTGLVLIIIGVVLTPIYCLGTPLWVIGMMMRFGSSARSLRCTRCGYSSANPTTLPR